MTNPTCTNCRFSRAHYDLLAERDAEIERLRAEKSRDQNSWAGALLIAQTQLATARGEITRLREALTKLRDCDWVISLPDRMDAVRDIARAALAKEK